jgi:threonine/homoserine/homoserine lactone efflux protein
VSVSIFVAFWIVSISSVVLPGADWAYAISAGLRERAVAPAVAGMLSGYLVITLVVAAGVGALVAGTPPLLGALTVIGAAYLLWLGVRVYVNPSVPSAGKEKLGTWTGWAMRGFVISGTNPKSILLFVALLPQFTQANSAWSVPAQLVTLGMVQIANCAVIYSLVGLGSRHVLRARPQVARRVSQISGVAMITIALLMLAAQFGGR